MRQARQKQLTLSADWLAFDHAKELQAIAGLLDEHPTIAELVWQDLAPNKLLNNRGAQGLSAEQILRALLSNSSTNSAIANWPSIWPTQRAIDDSVSSVGSSVRPNPFWLHASKSFGPKHSRRSIVLWLELVQTRRSKTARECAWIRRLCSRTFTHHWTRICCGTAYGC